jgi:hypothetical protein
LNSKKLKLLFYGKGPVPSFHPILNGQPLEWMASWKYLGVELCSGTVFSCSVTDRLKKFYKSSDAIFRVDGHSRELAMLRLVESHCVPILSYCIEVVSLKTDEARKLRVAYNSLFRRIFGFCKYDSVCELQGFLVRPTWEELVLERTEKFMSKLKLSENKIVASLIKQR